jgi:hypothetical protein
LKIRPPSLGEGFGRKAKRGFILLSGNTHISHPFAQANFLEGEFFNEPLRDEYVGVDPSPGRDQRLHSPRCTATA